LARNPVAVALRSNLLGWLRLERSNRFLWQLKTSDGSRATGVRQSVTDNAMSDPMNNEPIVAPGGKHLRRPWSSTSRFGEPCHFRLGALEWASYWSFLALLRLFGRRVALEGGLLMLLLSILVATMAHFIWSKTPQVNIEMPGTSRETKLDSNTSLMAGR